MLDFLTVHAQDVTVAQVQVGFTIPQFGDVLTFIIRIFFILSGLIAMLFLLLGAFAWITSGGNKEAVDKARDKIMNAVVGVILIFAVLAIVGLMEQLFFPADSGLGITKPIKFQRLVK